MRITFDLALDGYESLESRQLLDHSVCGPLGLLQTLETRLGLKSKPTTAARRAVQFQGVLESVAAQRPVFYGESFTKDPYAVAETLLRWRDELVEAGWDGQASATCTPRVRDMAAVQAAAAGCLSPGVADRLRAVLLELGRRPPGIESLTVRTPKLHLPKLWQEVCQRLNGQYEPGVLLLGAESAASDLGRLQSSLVDGSSDRRVQPTQDQTILCLTAGSEVALARGVAQILAGIRRNAGMTATLIANDRAGLLERALLAVDEPAVGLKAVSAARPIPQVLLLALRLYWKPLDPRALLEFLTHPVCPVSGPLRRRLANAVAASPGVGGPLWQTAVAEIQESVRSKEQLSASARKEGLERIDRDLKDWVVVSQFDALSAAGATLAECCARVARWALGRAGAPEIEPAEKSQFHALASLSTEMADLLGKRPSVNRSQVERLLHQVTASGWAGDSTGAQLGHVHRAARPGAVTEPVDVVVWWDFTEPPAPARAPWTGLELDQLRAHGVTFPTAEMVARKESAAWLCPVLSAKKQLVLVFPRKRGGELLTPHPLHARLLSLIDPERGGLPTIDLDRALTSARGAEPFRFRQLKHKPLPALKRWWRLPNPRLLGERVEESYSSAEKFIYSPYAWVLRYKAGLRAGPMASLRPQEDRHLKGTLLHRLLDLLLAAAPAEIDWLSASPTALEQWIERQWPLLLEQEAANFLLPGKRAEGVELLELGKLAMWDLLRDLRSAHVVEASSNQECSAAPFVGGKIGGIIDLLVRNRSGQRAVVDLKFGGAEVRERELQESRPLQLAVYSYLLSRQAGQKWPAGAFYLLRNRRLLAQTNAFFPEARVVPVKFPPGGMEPCWNDFEKVWRWRRRLLDQGWIEVTVGDTEQLPPMAEAPDSMPPVAQWLATEDHARFNEFDALTGWGREA
jgi:RecB family exonuclease